MSPAAQDYNRNLAASPVGSDTLSASPYKSTFSSFFRSSTTPEPVLEEQNTPLSRPITTLNTSAEALVHLEGCLDGLKRRPSGGESHVQSSEVADSTPVASPSTITTTLALSPIQTENLNVEMGPTVETDLADACGWIFTGLVLEIVSLASESCRAAEETVKGPIVEGHEDAGNHPIVEDVESGDKPEEVPTSTQDKGKQRADAPDKEVEQEHIGHRRRRFSLSFNFKGMLNLDDIEERLNENPQTCVEDHEHKTPDWDTLCELLRHLVELHHHEEFRLIETTHQYPIPLDLVFAHSPRLVGPLPVITAKPLASAAASPTTSPMDVSTCHGDPDCPESHTHLSNGRKALTILCGRLKNLIEQREEIRLHGHKSSAELDALEVDIKERVVWVKACLACCLYLLARSESPSQLYLLQLEELLPTGISHIDYLVNDIVSTFAPKTQPRGNARQPGKPIAPTTNGLGMATSPTKSQRTTLGGHRRTLSAKPSSIFSFASSVFSVGGRFHRPVKSATSLPQLSYEAVSTYQLEPEVGTSLSTMTVPSPAPAIRRSGGSSGSAASILEKYHQTDSSRGVRGEGNAGEGRSPWSRFSSLRGFRQSNLTANGSLPRSIRSQQTVGRSDSEQSLVSVGSSMSRPRDIGSVKIKADNLPRLSDSVTSEETNESQGLEIPAIKTIASTPSPRVAGMFPQTPPNDSAGHLKPRIRSKSRAFENKLALAPLDPALAAAEKASVLNRKNQCVVCGKEGYNFPACRKCKETFCSRECRVGFNKGGDGKKHVCGMTKSCSQFLEVPQPEARSRGQGRLVA